MRLSTHELGAGARRNLLVALLLAASFHFQPQPAAAEGWDELAAQSDIIAVGECADESSGWEDQGLITTTVRFRLHRVFKGSVSRALTVKVLGGRVGDESMSASHGATLAAGEQVVLFLKHSEFGDYYVVAGGEQGKVVVDEVPAEWLGAPAAGTASELTRLLNRAAVER
jgi:hypothetical protein